jgi:hypothetical protein
MRAQVEERQRAIEQLEKSMAVAVRQQDGSLRANLPQGWIELVAISAESRSGKEWWRPDGRAYVGEVFENEGSKVFPNEAQQARDFVFRTQGLPADASQPTFAFDSPAKMAGGGHPIRRGEPVPGHYFLSAALQVKGGTVTARAGVAIGPWETLHEHAGRALAPRASPQWRGLGVFLTRWRRGGGFVSRVTHTHGRRHESPLSTGRKRALQQQRAAQHVWRFTHHTATFPSAVEKVKRSGCRRGRTLGSCQCGAESAAAAAMSKGRR